MPFDVAGFVEAPVKNTEEIAILDKMARVLENAESWCQGVLEMRFDSGRSVCAVGAFNEAAFGTADLSKAYTSTGATPAMFAVWRALQNHLPEGFTNIPEFNDSDYTSHQDVLSFIARTRKSFE